jgi:hypothetical protein
MTELEQLVKELEDENDQLKSTFEKDKAIASQSLEFYKLQLEQERS